MAIWERRKQNDNHRTFIFAVDNKKTRSEYLNGTSLICKIKISRPCFFFNKLNVICFHKKLWLLNNPTTFYDSFNHKKKHTFSFMEHFNRCEVTIKKQKTLKKTTNSHQSGANKLNHTESLDSILSIIQE